MYAITPLDGRYNKDVKELSTYFSEYALFRERYYIEVKYFKTLLQSLHKITADEFLSFTEDSYIRIKEIEKEINHDVKAVEYFIKETLHDNLKPYSELIHFGLTSHDINNLAVKINLKQGISAVLLPRIMEIMNKLDRFCLLWGDVHMLSRTHGQPATPTVLGKEMKVYNARLLKQVGKLLNFKLSVKFGGSTGGLNAHKFVFPNTDWVDFMKRFVESYEFMREEFTTQICHYDNLCELLSIFKRINTILIDMCQDIWLYISHGYFKLKKVDDEVGSSTMPHKVNPIFFENAEGNLGLANSIIHHLEDTLPVSRLQRDLTDSTVIRNLGSIFGYILKSYKSILTGLDRLDIDKNIIAKDLDNNWSVVTEGIQTLLRYYNYAGAYEKLKELSRGQFIDEGVIKEFINSLDVNQEIKDKLLTLSPHSY